MLAKAIISAATPDLHHGETETPSFILDMDKVFEDFIYRALADKLTVGAMKWRHEKETKLDVAGHVTIKPDLSLWRGKQCAFVGDVKYKRTALSENDDLYQVISYTKALGLRDTLLIYAEADQTPTHVVRRDGTRVHVQQVDLGVSVEHLDVQITQLASTVEALSGVKAPALAAA